jgi:hypothetical protein
MHPEVYLLDMVGQAYKKRHIASPAVMDRYNFDWNKIHIFTMDPNIIPTGTEITNP